MDPVLDELGRVAAGLEPAAPRVPWAWRRCPATWSAEPERGVLDAQAAGSRSGSPTRSRALAAQGIAVFVEIGPDGTLSGAGGRRR